MTTNVNSKITDDFYRYKMPKILAKTEGRGNGIKTVLVNLPEVAKALARPPMYLTKHFGFELGALSQFDSKNNKHIINGAHSPSDIQNLLNRFIRHFVLCSKCDNPETMLSCNGKSPPIKQSCNACGHCEFLDASHKLTAYIFKHLSIAEPNKEKASERPGKSGRKVTKPKKETRVKNDKATLKNKKDSVSDECDEDVEWSEDISPEAVKKRQEECLGWLPKTKYILETLYDEDIESDETQPHTLCKDSEKSQTDKADIFYSYVKQRISDVANSTRSVENDIFLEAKRLGLIQKAPLILVEVLFSTNVVNELKQYKNIFIRFRVNDFDSEKIEKSILNGIEQLIELHKSVLLPKTQHILKALYDEDIVSDDVLIRWARKPCKKLISEEVHLAIMEKAEPLIQWLEIESEEEEEIVHDNNARESLEALFMATKKGSKLETLEEDIDIDAI